MAEQVGAPPPTMFVLAGPNGAGKTTFYKTRLRRIVNAEFVNADELALLEDARTAGFRIFVYHLNVADADTAVLRVASRVAQGGHPAPEDRIRARYERNQPLIRQAVLSADRGYVFDSTGMGRRPQHLITFADGRSTLVADDLPDWAIELYGGDLP